MDPIVVDNFLPEAYQISFYNLLTGPVSPFTYYFNKFSVNGSGNPDAFKHLYFTDEPTQEHVQFNRDFVKDNQIVNEEFYKNFAPLVACFETHTNSKVGNIIRIKANLLVNQEGPKLQPPHVDGMRMVDDKYICMGKKSLIYYVNNSDGDTILYNERFTGEPVGRVTEQMRVKPKKGRAVIFDSNQIHSGTAPTNKAYRVVINCIFGE
jgi:hypothetical protein